MRLFLDLFSAYEKQKEDIDSAIAEVLTSGSFVLGKQLERFEKEWADYTGAKYAIGVGSGLDALSLALQGLRIGPGDEVIVPSFTFVATWLAVSQSGAEPIPVDCDVRSFNIDADLIESAITKRTRAIIPVHLFGQPADLTQINEIARHYNLLVIEDAAQAHGAELEGVKIGGHGNTACWSFYPAKNLGAMGDAGAITTDCEQLRDSLLTLRNYGSNEKYYHVEFGRNSRMDEIQAAILRQKLKTLDLANSVRQEIANFYSSHLDLSKVKIPEIPSCKKSAWHQFVVLSSSRDELKEHLQSKGIPTLVHYPIPPHQQEIYQGKFNKNQSLERAEFLKSHVLSLPIDPFADSDLCKQTASAVASFNNEKALNFESKARK